MSNRVEQCCTVDSQFEEVSLSADAKKLIVRLCDQQPELANDLLFGADLYEDEEQQWGYMVCEGSGLEQCDVDARIVKYPHQYKIYVDMVKAGAVFVASDEFSVYQEHERSIAFLCNAANGISLAPRSAMTDLTNIDASMESTYDRQVSSIKETYQSNPDVAMGESSFSPFSSESFQTSASNEINSDMTYETTPKERMERLSGLFSTLMSRFEDLQARC